MKMIDERAKEYANVGATLFMDSPEEDIIYRDDLARAYAAGAKEEHDELTVHYEAEIAKYKQDLDESWERENIACKAVAEKRKEITRLTRWNDPQEELPQERRDVEVKTDKGKVSVCNMSLDERGRRFWNVSRTDYMIPNANIIGWREIHE